MLPKPIIYLDYNATTPVAPEVVNEMLPFFLTNYGNASSNDHLLGWQAKEVVEKARASIAANFNSNNADIIFTGGATESINIVLRGLNIPNKDHIITCKTEHNAVLDTCKALELDGTRITYLDVDQEGIIDLRALEQAIDKKTKLVSIMWVNNETGVIQPIERIAQICRDNGVVFMTDATQAVGKLPIDLTSLPIDIILGSAHKIYGPKGVGFLRVTKKIQELILPIITGGGQEYRLRAGTTNVASIAGMAKAIDLAYNQLAKDSEHIKSLRDSFEQKLINSNKARVIGSANSRLYNTSSLSFGGFDSERIMQAIGNKVAASRGSACSTGKIEASHVLRAMNISNEDAHSAIRFSFGRYTTEEEVEQSVEFILTALKSI